MGSLLRAMWLVMPEDKCWLAWMTFLRVEAKEDKMQQRKENLASGYPYVYFDQVLLERVIVC